MSAPNVLTSHAFVYFNTNDADDDIHTHMRVTRIMINMRMKDLMMKIQSDDEYDIV